MVASRQALESWLIRHILKPKTPKTTPAPSGSAAPQEGEGSAAVPTEAVPKQESPQESAPKESSELPISVLDVVCTHGKLDPEKVNNMKVIKAVSDLSSGSNRLRD